MNKITLAAGFGVVCPKTQRILCAPHRRKRAFEQQLARSGWKYRNGLWISGDDSPDWRPYEPLPEDIHFGRELSIYCAVARDGSNQIVHVEWYDNSRSAQKHFERHGMKIEARKLID